MKKIVKKVKGMSCASCAASIENALKTQDFVKRVSINYALETGTFEILSDNDFQKVESIVNDLGFSLTAPTKENQASEKNSNLTKFIISFVLSIGIFSLAMGPAKNLISSQKLNWQIQMLLSLPIWLWVGFIFQKAALSFITFGRSNMNTLIGLGTSAAFIYSSFIALFPNLAESNGLQMRVYFEAVGFIISFVFLGKYFEDKAKKKTMEALNALFDIAAKRALLVNKDGDVREIPVEDIVAGDLVRVLPGAKIPVDGKVTRGVSSVNEAMISGEPLPVEKSTDSELFAGTVNCEGTLDYLATRVGAETFFAQIVEYVKEAQNNKPEIQRYADRVVSVFAPLVVMVALATFALWYFLGPLPVWGNAVSNCIAVLVIACPCALGLATPTAVAVSTGLASLRGVLIGGGEVIEKASEVDVVVFDKTGTLTHGQPEVIEYLSQDENILSECAGLEQFSEHPLSAAVIKYAAKFSKTWPEPDYFQSVQGKGIIGSFDDQEFILGNKGLLEHHGVSIQETLKPSKIGSFIFVSKNKKHVATFVIGDTLKTEARDLMRRFKEENVATYMLTGDNNEIASAVADELKVDFFESEMLPLEKTAYVKQLRSGNRKVMMVGDGINDAPALVEADISVAMGTGTDVAINSADATLVKGDLRELLYFLKLSKISMRKIRQNLFLSLVYNCTLIPVAAGVLVLFGGPAMSPILASIAMGLSSISVVLNSLSIRRLV